MLFFDYHPLDNTAAMAPRPLLSLLVLVPLLMIDAIVELSFVSAMVGFLHGRGSDPFEVLDTIGGTFEISSTPEKLLENQGHTSNGAAGTAFILIGIGGLLAIWLQHRRMRSVSMSSETPLAKLTATQTGFPRPSAIFTFWVVLTILSALLTLSSLIYTFLVTYQHKQSINMNTATAYPFPLAYPTDEWTPETWYSALLELPLSFDSDRSKIHQQLTIMRGWRWNLIPLFVLGLITAYAAVYEWFLLRRQGSRDSGTSKDRTGQSFY